MVLGHNLNHGDRTQDVKIIQDVTFETMLLSDTTLKGLKKSGFHKPSPIQLHGIPLGKCGFDLLLEAKSGTGKTAVFTVIALEKINLNNGLQVIILAPTREIAAQICDVIKQIGREHTGLTVEVVMGGLPVKDDIEKLKKKVHIIVGSPGRLHHLIRDKHINISSVRLLILDEADKLMEKSFKADIEYIFSNMPLQKQIIFSSATFPEESKAFINKYVQVSQHICPDSNSVLIGISQKVTIVSHNANVVRQTQHRFEELLKILSKKEFKQCLIFCNYQARVTDLYRMLKRANWPAEKLYGQQDQLDRLDALKTLQEYKCRILIATDLAARGLDSSHVDLVINFEPPYEWQTYLHRIGRAGRYGAYGLAVTILSNQEENTFKKVLKSMQFQLDIKNFWTDEQFEYNDNVSKTVMPLEHTMTQLKLDDDDEVPNDETYSELWEAICEVSNGVAVETFEDLCASFTNTKDKIESFSDLVNSFQNNDAEDTDNIKYQCLKTISVTKYKRPTKVDSSHNQVDINLKTDADSFKGEVESYHPYTLEEEEEIYPIRPHENSRPKVENKKEKRNRHKNANKTNKNKNNRFKSTQRKTYQGNEENESSEESDDNGYNTASYDFKKSQGTSANNENHSCNGQYNSYPHQQNRNSNDLNEYTSNYINWYNYLKFRMQQIEMAVYINEMSQL